MLVQIMSMILVAIHTLGECILSSLKYLTTPFIKMAVVTVDRLSHLGLITNDQTARVCLKHILLQTLSEFHFSGHRQSCHFWKVFLLLIEQEVQGI